MQNRRLVAVLVDHDERKRGARRVRLIGEDISVHVQEDLPACSAQGLARRRNRLGLSGRMQRREQGVYQNPPAVRRSLLATVAICNDGDVKSLTGMLDTSYRVPILALENQLCCS